MHTPTHALLHARLLFLTHYTPPPPPPPSITPDNQPRCPHGNRHPLDYLQRASFFSHSIILFTVCFFACANVCIRSIFCVFLTRHTCACVWRGGEGWELNVRVCVCVCVSVITQVGLPHIHQTVSQQLNFLHLVHGAEE